MVYSSLNNFFQMQSYKHSKDRVEMRKCGWGVLKSWWSNIVWMKEVTHVEGKLHQTADVTGVDHGWLALDRTAKFSLHQRVDSGQSVGLWWVCAVCAICKCLSRTYMENEGMMVFSIVRATATGIRSVCSLRLKTQPSLEAWNVRAMHHSRIKSAIKSERPKQYCTYVEIISWASSSRV